MPNRLSTVPARIISHKEINLEEYANAEAGVAMGNINAKLLGKMTVIVARTGLMP